MSGSKRLPWNPNRFPTSPLLERAEVSWGGILKVRTELFCDRSAPEIVAAAQPWEVVLAHTRAGLTTGSLATATPIAGRVALR